MTSQDCVYEGRDYKQGDVVQSLQFLLHWCLRTVYEGRDYKQGDFFQSLSFCCSDVSRLCVWGQRLQAGRLLPVSKFLLQWRLRTVCMRAETTSRETSSGRSTTPVLTAPVLRGVSTAPQFAALTQNNFPAPGQWNPTTAVVSPAQVSADKTGQRSVCRVLYICLDVQHPNNI